MKKAAKTVTAAKIDKAPKSLHRVHSSLVLDGPDRAASRAMLYPVGFNTGDFKKSLIGIASTWSMVTPCNMHTSPNLPPKFVSRQSPVVTRLVLSPNLGENYPGAMEPDTQREAR